MSTQPQIMIALSNLEKLIYVCSLDVCSKNINIIHEAQLLFMVSLDEQTFIML